MDFFTVSTLSGRVLFVLVVLAHHRRRIVHLNITDHPTAIWAAQQVVDAFPDDTAPRWLHRDRDGIYGDPFQRRVAGMGTDVVSVPASPWQHPYVERVIGSIRRECLDHIIVFNAAHLGRVLTTYVTYYHRSRTHLGLEKDTPDHRRRSDTSTGRIVAIAEVGGLHHRYERLAASTRPQAKCRVRRLRCTSTGATHLAHVLGPTMQPGSYMHAASTRHRYRSILSLGISVKYGPTQFWRMSGSGSPARNGTRASRA
jgi:integrase-like protein